MRKLLRAARKALIPICLFLTFLMVGWRFFPNYLVLPNLADYAISYLFSSNETEYGVLSEMAEQRLGERGAVSFIEAGLESNKAEKIAKTFVAVRELDKTHGDSPLNRRLFFLVADFFSRQYGPEMDSYRLFMLRDQALRYFFRQDTRPWFDSACRERLLDVFLRNLEEPEQRLSAKYLLDREWFVEPVKEVGLGWSLDDSDLCEECEDEEGEENDEALPQDPRE